MGLGRLPELDGFRGVAILLVLVGHFLGFSLGFRGGSASLASAGVSLFCALSGFLITSLLLREEQRYGGIDLPRFYVRRAVRLLPAAWLLIGTVAALKVAGAITDESWGGVGASLFYVRNVFGRGNALAHLWSLSLEEQFYLVWPLLFVTLPRHRLAVSLAVCLAVALARIARVNLGHFDFASGVLYVRPWFRFDACLVGCVLALLRLRFPDALVSTSGVLRALQPLPCALLLALATGVYSSRFGAWSLTAQTWLCVPLLYRCVAPGARYYRALLRARPLRLLGRVSYSAYLWQQLFLVQKTPDWGLLRTPGVDLVCVAVCTLLAYFCVEKPCLALKDRLGARRKLPQPPPDLSPARRTAR